MMWEVCRSKVEAAGGKVEMAARLTATNVAGGRATRSLYSQGGCSQELPAST